MIERVRASSFFLKFFPELAGTINYTSYRCWCVGKSISSFITIKFHSAQSEMAPSKCEVLLVILSEYYSSASGPCSPEVLCARTKKSEAFLCGRECV